VTLEEPLSPDDQLNGENESDINTNHKNEEQENGSPDNVSKTDTDVEGLHQRTHTRQNSLNVLTDLEEQRTNEETDIPNSVCTTHMENESIWMALLLVLTVFGITGLGLFFVLKDVIE
jgi:hypothetical protein